MRNPWIIKNEANPDACDTIIFGWEVHKIVVDNIWEMGMRQMLGASYGKRRRLPPMREPGYRSTEGLPEVRAKTTGNAISEPAI